MIYNANPASYVQHFKISVAADLHQDLSRLQNNAIRGLPVAAAEGSEKIGEDKSPDQISIESAEDQEPVAAAAAISDSKLGNVQSPASVWLPYKDSNVNRNKVDTQALSSLLAAHSLACGHIIQGPGFTNLYSIVVRTCKVMLGQGLLQMIYHLKVGLSSILFGREPFQIACL